MSWKNVLPLNRSEFCQILIGLSVSYASKNAYSAGKTNGVLRVGASGANRCYALAHCGGANIFTHNTQKGDKHFHI